jgi:hypothetical protein
METDAEFEQFYQKVLKELIDTNEVLRKKTQGKVLRYVYIPLLFFILLSCLFTVALFISIVLLPIYIIVFVGIYKYNRQAYLTAFGNSVTSAMVAFIDNRLTYNADKSIQNGAITISRLFMDARGSDGSNYVEGQLGETFIQFSEVTLNLGMGFGENIFKGIFLIATFNKYFNGDYFVFSGHHTNPNAQFTDVQKLVLEDTEFNKQFTAYGSDEVEGRYLLTPAMMQRMLDFKSKVDEKVYFSFTRSRMFIAIGNQGGILFEPGIWRPVEYEKLALWNKYLQFAIGVVGDFDLNTRIWSKK